MEDMETEITNDNGYSSNLKEMINELIIREFERSLEHKREVEEKAASYMIAATLILTILTTFMAEIKNLKIDKYYFMSFVVLYIILFVLGLVLLLVFVYMLKPRNISYFGIQGLKDLMNRIDKDDNEKTDKILQLCEKFEEENRKTVQELDSYNKIVSFWVPILVVGFGIEFVEFVVALIISLGGR